MGLAHQLNKSAKLCAKSVLPRAHRLVDESYPWQFDVPIQGSPRVCRMDTGGCDRPPPRKGRDGRDNRGGRGFIVIPQICPPPHGSAVPPSRSASRLHCRPWPHHIAPCPTQAIMFYLTRRIVASWRHPFSTTQASDHPPSLHQLSALHLSLSKPFLG